MANVNMLEYLCLKAAWMWGGDGVFNTAGFQTAVKQVYGAMLSGWVVDLILRDRLEVEALGVPDSDHWRWRRRVA